MGKQKVFRKKSCKRFVKFAASVYLYGIEVLGKSHGRKSRDLECVARVLRSCAK